MITYVITPGPNLAIENITSTKLNKISIKHPPSITKDQAIKIVNKLEKKTLENYILAHQQHGGEPFSIFSKNNRIVPTPPAPVSPPIPPQPTTNTTITTPVDIFLDINSSPPTTTSTSRLPKHLEGSQPNHMNALRLFAQRQSAINAGPLTTLNKEFNNTLSKNAKIIREQLEGYDKDLYRSKEDQELTVFFIEHISKTLIKIAQQYTIPHEYHPNLCVGIYVKDPTTKKLKNTMLIIVESKPSQNNEYYLYFCLEHYLLINKTTGVKFNIPFKYFSELEGVVDERLEAKNKLQRFFFRRNSANGLYYHSTFREYLDFIGTKVENRPPWTVEQFKQVLDDNHVDIKVRLASPSMSWVKKRFFENKLQTIIKQNIKSQNYQAKLNEITLKKLTYPPLPPPPQAQSPLPEPQAQPPPPPQQPNQPNQANRLYNPQGIPSNIMNIIMQFPQYYKNELEREIRSIPEFILKLYNSDETIQARNRALVIKNLTQYLEFIRNMNRYMQINHQFNEEHIMKQFSGIIHDVYLKTMEYILINATINGISYAIVYYYNPYTNGYYINKLLENAESARIISYETDMIEYKDVNTNEIKQIKVNDMPRERHGQLGTVMQNTILLDIVSPKMQLYETEWTTNPKDTVLKISRDLNRQTTTTAATGGNKRHSPKLISPPMYHTIKGRKYKVYVGPRGGKYVKSKGAFVRIRI